jgi:hypothetical protein
MADETEVQVEAQETQTQVDPAIETEARRGGWKPLDQWKGDKSGWVDAQTFVKRGREIAPHLARQAGELRNENATLKQQQADLARQLEETKSQVAALTTFREEMAGNERKRIREELVAELAVARQNGDYAAEAAILGKLATPPPAPPPVKTEPPKPAVQQPPGLPQEMTDWVANNDWYKKDPVLQQAMNIVGAELRATGAIAGMSLTDQLDATARVVLQRYAPPPANGGSRVEGGGSRSSGDGVPRGTPDNSWEALPAHIKQECDAQGERLGLVGKGKPFATKEDFRKHYTREYNRYAPGTGYDFRPPGN